jgi:hypothetical protein
VTTGTPVDSSGFTAINSAVLAKRTIDEYRKRLRKQGLSDREIQRRIDKGTWGTKK